MLSATYERRFPESGSTSREIRIRKTDWDTLCDDTIVELKIRARLTSLMKLYCSHGPVDMHEKMFKFLQHYSANGRQVRLEEFKAGPVRLFGFSRNVHARSVFFVTGMDVAKKQARANQRLVEKAGEEAIRLSGLIAP